VKLQVPFDFAQGRLSPTLPRISCPVEWRWRTSCGFPHGKPHTSPWMVLRFRKSGSAAVPRHAGAGGMTKLRAVAHLGMSGGGWTESKKTNLDKSETQQLPISTSHGLIRQQNFAAASTNQFHVLQPQQRAKARELICLRN
jgi:hypothetical protein